MWEDTVWFFHYKNDKPHGTALKYMADGSKSILEYKEGVETDTKVLKYDEW